MRSNAGVTYLESVIGAGIVLVIVAALGGALTFGQRVSQMISVRATLLAVAQAEMERARGFPFDRLEGYHVEADAVSGEVVVERLTNRRKRVSVVLRHAQQPNQPLILVSYVHLHGVTP